MLSRTTTCLDGRLLLAILSLVLFCWLVIGRDSVYTIVSFSRREGRREEEGRLGGRGGCVSFVFHRHWLRVNFSSIPVGRVLPVSGCFLFIPVFLDILGTWAFEGQQSIRSNASEGSTACCMNPLKSCFRWMCERKMPCWSRERTSAVLTAERTCLTVTLGVFSVTQFRLWESSTDLYSMTNSFTLPLNISQSTEEYSCSTSIQYTKLTDQAGSMLAEGSADSNDARALSSRQYTSYFCRKILIDFGSNLLWNECSTVIASLLTKELCSTLLKYCWKYYRCPDVKVGVCLSIVKR